MPPFSSSSDDLLKVNAPRKMSPRTYGIITRVIRPLLAFIILGVMVVVFMGPFHDDALPPRETPTALPSNTSNDLIAPKFSSTDPNGNPFTLTARRAVQGQDNPDLLTLETPTGTMTLSSGITITGGAPTGIYNQTTTDLDLSGGVVLTTSDGYDATTDHIYLNTKTKDITADKPMRITGPKGSVTAASAHGNLTTGILVLNGPAAMILTDGEF